MTIQLGYACINMTLQETKKIQCNRGMIKRTFMAKGIEYASELALSNVRGLREVIKWNNENGIKVYRMTSCLFPWFSEYDIFDLPGVAPSPSCEAGGARAAAASRRRRPLFVLNTIRPVFVSIS